MRVRFALQINGFGWASRLRKRRRMFLAGQVARQTPRSGPPGYGTEVACR